MHILSSERLLAVQVAQRVRLRRRGRTGIELQQHVGASDPDAAQLELQPLHRLHDTKRHIPAPQRRVRAQVQDAAKVKRHGINKIP